MKIEKELELFLRKEKILTKFKKNVIKELITNDCTLFDIRGSFVWYTTPEGLQYWSDINKKFDATKQPVFPPFQITRVSPLISNSLINVRDIE